MMLGRLAKWLRLFGYDTVYYRQIDDNQLINIAISQRRVLLTRDTLLLKRKPINRGLVKAILIEGDYYLDQLYQLISLLDLKTDLLPRCSVCNQVLKEISSEKVRDKVPAYVFRTQNKFFNCSSCSRIYWSATHWQKISEVKGELGQCKRGAGEPATDREKLSGIAYLCPTPIGNLEDITVRAINVLKNVDLIAAEDTRRTKKLTSKYQIHQRLVSFNKDNERRVLPKLINFLKQGKSLALVSDAGTPGLADAGYSLVKACQKENIRYEVLPGANAVIPAVVMSGFPANDIRFLGFLPRKSSQRKRFLTQLCHSSSTLVLFESPHRLKQSLKIIEEVIPDRSIFVVREMTKKFEQRYWGKASEIIDQLSEPMRGEFALVISAKKPAKPDNYDIEAVVKEAEELIAKGLKKKEACRLIAKKYGYSASQVYNHLL
jgi:16S rRNA (cytidine1402-2'-O)-methyltransferase